MNIVAATVGFIIMLGATGGLHSIINFITNRPQYNVGDCLYSVQNDMNGNPQPFKDIVIKIIEKNSEDYYYTYVMLDGVRIEGNLINHEHSFVENTSLFVKGVCP